jgi:adenosylmethionine-8-amino-7-oxononanoate aminotransferase
MDAAMKLARQYFLELTPPQPLRTRFIARRQSYHGATLGPLALGGHAARRAPFEPLLAKNFSHVSPCYAYRGVESQESEEGYVARLARELDEEFARFGPGTVCAFVAEPVVGAVSPAPSFFIAPRLTVGGAWLRAQRAGLLRGGARGVRTAWRAACL